MKKYFVIKSFRAVQPVIVIIFFWFHSTSGHAQDYNINEPLSNFYSKIDNSIWDSINNYQYGVAGSGFIGKDEFIGKCTAKIMNSGGPWIPIDGYKHTLCGNLIFPHNKIIEHYDHGLFDVYPDYDMDFYVFPQSSSQWLLLKSKNIHGNDWLSCTVLGEVALHEPGNTISNDGVNFLQSIPIWELQNKGIGMYGAWVSDYAHDDHHPEIHPIEQMWYKNEINLNNVEFYLYSMHDNDARFGRTRYFEPNNCNDLPWVKNPQVNTYYLPFEVTLINKGLIDYNIDLLSGNNINFEDTMEQVLRLLYKGVELMIIRTPKMNSPVISLKFLGMKDSEILRGYIAIQTSICKPGLTSGGHAFYKVAKTIKPAIFTSPILPNIIKNNE